MKKLILATILFIGVVLICFLQINESKAVGLPGKDPYNARCLKEVSVGILKGEFKLELGHRVKCESGGGMCSKGLCD
jgi:hypothetical protein